MPEPPTAEVEPPRKRRSPSWGRLIAKLYQIDPARILDHLGLSIPEAEKPPPPAQEVLRVAEHGDGRAATATSKPHRDAAECALRLPGVSRAPLGRAPGERGSCACRSKCLSFDLSGFCG
jgi:hypothetical protein